MVSCFGWGRGCVWYKQLAVSCSNSLDMLDLLAPHFDVNFHEDTRYRHTALHHAALRGRHLGVSDTIAIVNKVLAHGGDPFALNKQKVCITY